MTFTCSPVGDTAIMVRFEQVIAEHVNRRVVNMAFSLEKRAVKGIVEIVPAYASLMIYYNPLELSYEEIVQIVQQLADAAPSAQQSERTVLIPALYGGEYGPDLGDVARYHQISEERVIQLHSSVRYRVYMLGFSPGFPYLGGLPDVLATPRLATPRLHIPAGSIGIAGAQTGIYSVDSPGGWRIIAHTPVPLFQLDRDPPFLLRIGDWLRFQPVTPEQYDAIAQQVAAGTYTPEWRNEVKEGDER